MTSSKIEALGEFYDSLVEVDILLNQANAMAALGTGTPLENETGRALANASTRACVVMLVAHFEGFVKLALTELIDSIREAKPPNRRVPDGLLEIMTRDRLVEIAACEGVERSRRIRKLFTAYGPLWEDGRTINPALMSDRILAKQLTNARPETLDQVFVLLDVAGLTAGIQASLDSEAASSGNGCAAFDVRMKLDEIVDRRNEIAHGDRDVKPTAVEVVEYINFLRDVAGAIATVVGERIRYCCSLG
ncbi:hypothetical protein ABIA35_006903 [Catenulispora sp. MAP12-49]|uniref:MAE_28990/MAE_18760 family HEPN-like nuclease n=1 Tax=Catenulispora sp. MAP12-49 TaxID=3156302 RepID=UPI00351494C6